MSFKRDGDDDNLLRNLNHQRVKELLSSHIPQDEAKLLSNGRLACMICLHRPIFDTINMLATHRKGKRHLLELSKHIKCQEDAIVKSLQRKRPHSNIMGKDISWSTHDRPTSNLLITLSQSPVLGSKHAVCKQSVFKHKRKPVLEMQSKVSPKVPILSSSFQTDVSSSSATVRHYLKKMSRKSSLEGVVEKNRENYGIDLQKENDRKAPAKTPKSLGKEVPKPDHPDTKSAVSQSPNSDSQNYELKLRMSGWIKDSSGKWIKDPNVEFDSDEDENPPLLI